MPIGFNRFMDLVTLRPPAREEAMNVLLELTTRQGKGETLPVIFCY